MHFFTVSVTVFIPVYFRARICYVLLPCNSRKKFCSIINNPSFNCYSTQKDKK
nr:MAG TPA: hypothetical protein [Caudoviricetes sp.]